MVVHLRRLEREFLLNMVAYFGVIGTGERGSPAMSAE
jgi:hypothetical protein